MRMWHFLNLALLSLVVVGGCSAKESAKEPTIETIGVAASAPSKQSEQELALEYELERLPDCDRVLVMTLGNRVDGMNEFYRGNPELMKDDRKFKDQYYLMIYSTTGHLDKVKELVESGRVDIDLALRMDDDGPALAWAARCNRAKVIEYLIAKGANVNVRFSYIRPAGILHKNVTPLLWATEFESPEAAQVLRKHGAIEIDEEIVDFSKRNLPLPGQSS